MKKIQLALAVVLPVLYACGTDTSTPKYLIHAGTYNVTSVTFTKDECKLTTLPATMAIDVNATTSAVTFTDLGASADSHPTGVKTGNNFTAKADYVYDNTKDTPPIDCKEHLVKTIAASMDSDDHFSATFTWDDSVSAGAACTQAALGYPVPCQSVATFKGAIK